MTFELWEKPSVGANDISLKKSWFPRWFGSSKRRKHQRHPKKQYLVRVMYNGQPLVMADETTCHLDVGCDLNEFLHWIQPVTAQ